MLLSAAGMLLLLLCVQSLLTVLPRLIWIGTQFFDVHLFGLFPLASFVKDEFLW